MNDELVRMRLGENLAELLRGPFGVRMGCDIDVQNPPRADFHRHEYIKDVKGRRDRDKEIASDDRIGVVPEQCRPRLISTSTVGPISFQVFPNRPRPSGRLRADLQRARAAERAATASLGIAQRDLKRAVTTAYYRLLLTRRLVKVIEGALDESRSFERRSQLLFQNGEAARADVVKAQSQTSILEVSLKNAQAEAELANQELAAFWTRDVAVQLGVEDVFEKPTLSPEDIPAAQDNPYLRRLEFNLLDAQKRTFEAQARIARSALLPHLTFAFQYGLDAAAYRAKDRGDAAIANLNIPVFDWWKARAAMQQFQLRAQQVEVTRSITERATSKEYESARTRVRYYFAQIAALEHQVQLAEEDLSLSRVRYEGGEGSALDVVTAQNQLAQARSGYYTNLANYLNARADLEVASGR